jgi:hypothetical protein
MSRKKDDGFFFKQTWAFDWDGWLERMFKKMFDRHSSVITPPSPSYLKRGQAKRGGVTSGREEDKKEDK